METDSCSQSQHEDGIDDCSPLPQLVAVVRCDTFADSLLLSDFDENALYSSSPQDIAAVQLDGLSLAGKAHGAVERK